MALSAPPVFLNVPFDAEYWPILKAMVFTLLHTGFDPRCALERNDSSEVRIDKICGIIDACQLSVHDLSRTEVDRGSQLPRFNMPFEFGIFFGAKRFGGARHKRKACLVYAKQPFVYQKFISDISGQDIRAHADDPRKAVKGLRDWLGQFAKATALPSASEIWEDYELFLSELPALCVRFRLRHTELDYLEFKNFAGSWLEEERKNAP